MNFPTGLGEGVIAGPGAIEVNPMACVSFHQGLRARWAVVILGIFNLLPVPSSIFFLSIHLKVCPHLKSPPSVFWLYPGLIPKGKLRER